MQNCSLSLSMGTIRQCGGGLHRNCSHPKGATALRAFLSSHRLNAVGIQKGISMNKTDVLDAMRSGYNALEKPLAPLDEAQMTTPGVNGTWSIKDNIAHIVTWQHILRDRLHAAAR